MVNIANLDESVQSNVEEFVQKLKGSIRISAAYLFGSYAKGTATPDSDIDVLILSPDFSEDRLENLLLLMKARRGINLQIEPHAFREEDFNENNPFFQEVRDDLIQIFC
jgi:uncharacterized protein